MSESNPCGSCGGEASHPVHTAHPIDHRFEPIAPDATSLKFAEIGRKFDGGKLLYSLIDTNAMAWLAASLSYGASKYSPGNWRQVPDARARYTDALMRHLEAWRAGEDDDDVGLPHLAGILVNAMFLTALFVPKGIAEATKRANEAIRQWKESSFSSSKRGGQMERVDEVEEVSDPKPDRETEVEDAPDLSDTPILGDRVYVYLQLAGMPGERELVAMSAEVIMARPDPMKPGLLVKPPNQDVSGLPAHVQFFASGYSAEPKLGYWSWPPRPLR